jgi:hypothetical protein
MSDRKGTLGTVSIVLPHWKDPEERYDRSYKPVTPVSRTVTGADDKIAPETDIATWSITDWSGGEGDLRWKDRARYNISTGNGPVSDGTGVRVGSKWTVATTQETRVIARGGGRLVAADAMDAQLQTWSGSAFGNLWAIGGGVGENAVSIASVDPLVYFVLGDDGNIRKTATGGNSEHNKSFAWDYIVGYNGVLYGIVGVDLYSIDQSSADTETIVYDDTETIVDDVRVKLLSVSDVGPIWAVPSDDGTTKIYEYNVADASGYVSHELPRDVYVYDIGFHDGIYLTTFRYTTAHTGRGDAYLHYKKGDARGVTGPLRSTTTAFPGSGSESKRVAYAGVVGDRIMLVFRKKVWAYDLTSGGISLVADLTTLTTNGEGGATTYGSSVFIADTSKYGVVDLTGYQVNTAQVLSTGLHDYGYLGLEKLVHTVTVATEDVLAATDKVEVGYSVDGGSITYLANDFAAATASHLWTVSTNSASVIGTEIEWHLRQTTTAESVCAKVVSLSSDVSGAKSRIEFTVAVDLGESSTTNGDTVLTALKTLKTTHAVVQWTDPFQVDQYTAEETYDVRVMDVSTPEYAPSGFTSAIVRFQTVGVVG